MHLEESDSTHTYMKCTQSLSCTDRLDSGPAVNPQPPPAQAQAHTREPLWLVLFCEFQKLKFYQMIPKEIWMDIFKREKNEIIYY